MLPDTYEECLSAFKPPKNWRAHYKEIYRIRVWRGEETTKHIDDVLPYFFWVHNEPDILDCARKGTERDNYLRQNDMEPIDDEEYPWECLRETGNFQNYYSEVNNLGNTISALQGVDSLAYKTYIGLIPKNLVKIRARIMLNTSVVGDE